MKEGCVSEQTVSWLLRTDGTAAEQQVMRRKYHPVHFDDVTAVVHQRRIWKKFLCDLIAVPHFLRASHFPFFFLKHAHMHGRKCSANVLAHAMIRGSCWGVSIYFIKASYYTPTACGEQYTVV